MFFSMWERILLVVYEMSLGDLYVIGGFFVGRCLVLFGG